MTFSDQDQEAMRQAVAQVMAHTPHLTSLGIVIELFAPHHVVVRRGGQLIFTEITATDQQGRTVAHALQTYRIA